MTACGACRVDPDASARYYERVVPPPATASSPFARRVAATVAELAPPPARILDLAAGDGEVSIELATAGHRVVAVERGRGRAIAARIGALRARRGSLRILEGSIESARPGGPFDVVLLLNSFGIGGDAGHAAVLARVAELLGADGRAVVDVFDPGWWRERPRSEGPFAGGLRQVAYCRACSRVVTTLHRDGVALHETIRCYAPAAFARLAAAQGLRVVGQADRLPDERGSGRRTSILRHAP
jgi:SAM-dependent methyltransferase